MLFKFMNEAALIHLLSCWPGISTAGDDIICLIFKHKGLRNPKFLLYRSHTSLSFCMSLTVGALLWLHFRVRPEEAPLTCYI